ncbi:transposase family protein [Nocardia sp. alder85J]|uniref:transposase family protein n=1 Tax=Nocardia sp. alder85J TaxID=2862949 RepID=UPI00224E2D12|nr:transposase family protein [Nocardia sp. alder85J]MCX4091840.1 transposase [Nocardia sp. alder85J]MCX4096801.1 transposase [Nocardia sp. alder85J]
MIAYSAMLDVPRELVDYVSRLLAGERRRLGTRRGTRALTPWKQAVFVLAWMRKRDDVAILGTGFGLGRSTAYRYRDEGVKVLAAQAPELREALERAAAEGMAYVILDGKIFETDRVGEKTVSVKDEVIDLWYSGKARTQGANIQAVSSPQGIPLWVSDENPGSIHDINAARELVFADLYRAATHLNLPTLADSGYEGAGIGVHTPVKQPPGEHLHVDNRAYNALLRGMRALGERGFALLSQRWRALQRITISPERAGGLVKAALVLTQFEHQMIS